MNKLVRKLVLLLIAFTLLMQNNIVLQANDFDTDREKYERMCFTKVDPDNAAVCRDFQAHINNQAKQVNQDLSKIRNDLSSIRANITEYAKQINDYQAQIEEMERQIGVLSRAIDRMEGEIEQLIAEIQVLEETIKIRDETIQQRMVSMQGFFSVNGLIDVVMGAASFTDLVRRVEGIKDITYYDNEQIKLMQAEMEKVEQDKIELERQRNVLEDNRENYVLTQESQKALVETTQEIIDEFRRQESQLIQQEREVISDLSAVQSQLRQLENALNAIPGSNGWMRPVLSNVYISAGVWTYPGGGRHIGVDFAAPIGTPIVAVANGVVVYRADNCPTWGYLGNRCGYPAATGGGNQVYLIVSVNNRSYAIMYVHMESGSPAPVGRVVSAGDVIGRVGSSGNSSGPHLHIEVIYLGTNSVNYYAQNWNGNLSFGAGWGETAYRNRCDANGFNAPCRMNPLTVFNVRVFQRY